mgnify:CR=1 FL=1
MAKLTKTQLKGIVKECLVEILTEGLASGSHLLETRAPVQKNTKSRKRTPSRSQSPALDKVLYTPRQEAPQPPASNEKFNNAINETVSTLTNDPVMSQIFADTARTTLQERMQAESGQPGAPSMIETAAPGVDIDQVDIFSESSQNWAALAFADNSPK